MASSYTGLGTELMTTGENAGTWGTTTNTNLQIIEQITGGYVEQAISSTTTTLSVSDGSTGATLGHRIIKFTGTLSGNSTVTIPLDVQQMYILVNGTSGTYTLTFKYVSGSGSTVAFGTTDKGTKIVYAAADHASNPNMVDTGISTNTLTGVTGNITVDSPADIILDADGANITMKDGGTTILDFVFNGTTDVTLDAPGDIKLDADGGDVFFVDGGTTFGSATNSSGNLILKSGTTTALTFSGANVTGSGTFEATTITASTAVVPDASDGATIGSASLEWSDLYLADGGVIYFGDDQEITLTHAADDGLILKHVGTADGKEPSLTFQAGDTDIAVDDVLGSIFFQAPDEGAGTDAILVAAGIEAVSEGDFSSSNNATKLSFKTGASEAATEKVTISSAGNLNLVASNTELRFYEGSNYVGFEAPALSGDQIWVLPAADGSNGQQLTTDGSGTLSWSAATVSAIAADDVSTGDAAVTIATSAGNITIDAQAGDTDIIFKGTDSSSDITALTLDMSAAGEAIFNAGLVIADAGNIGSASDKDAIAISSAGVVSLSATTEASATGTAALTLAGGLGVAKDVWIGDDVVLDSDSAVLKFGDDQDVTLTHTDGTGLTLNSTSKLTFGDAATYINQSSDGVMTVAGEATIDLTASTAVLVSNDLKLDSDSAVLGFGADNDTTLTHTDGTGLTLNSTNKLCFYDTALSISSSTDGQLDIDADTEVEITATTVDLNGILDVSGVIVAGGQISAADGTAGAPSISNTGDLNSGLYFSAADTLAFSAGGTAQFTMADGAIAPVTDNDVDLGTSGLEFKDGYFDGTLHCDVLDLNGTEHTSIEDPTALAIALG